MSFRRMRHVKAREIQGCQIALDASIPSSLFDATSGGSLVAANGSVARWEDLSGNGRHVTQSSSTIRPLRRVANQGGLDAVEFDGSDDRLINASISVALPTTSMAFGKATKGMSVFIDSYNNYVHALYRGGSGDQPNKFAVYNGSVTSVDDDSLWGGIVATHSSTGGITIRRGGLTGSTPNNASNSLNGASIGNLRGNPNPLLGSYALGGFIGEVAIWNIVLNQSLCKRINDSRSRKWRTDR